MAHIYTKQPAPMEYLKLVLCRDVYHCPPDQLPSYAECMRALAMIDGERQAQRAKDKSRRK
jgi:hypothetical protein